MEKGAEIEVAKETFDFLEAKAWIKVSQESAAYMYIYKWICENMFRFRFYKALQAHAASRGTTSSQRILLTSINTFHAVTGVRTTSYMVSKFLQI